MTTSEILEEIHQNKMELEIYLALQDWMLQDRKNWISKARESEATVRAVKKIATQTDSPKNALAGIISLCEE